MPKKIYDVKPPKTVRKVATKKTVVPAEDNAIKDFLKEEKPKMVQKAHKKEKRSVWGIISIIILIIVLAVGVYLFIKLPKADITIWPKVETLSFKQTITADKSVDLVDIAKTVVPAKYFQATKTNAQDFPATGNASNEGLATGTITISNKFDPPMPFTFRAGTRFISDSGKLFITLEKAVIPSAKKSGSKITPGTVQVKVQAVGGGNDYNIAPASFSIPGLKGTAYYFSVNATSDSPMTGGYSGKVKKVTDDDIQTAKEVLTKKTIADAVSDLKSQISSDYILLDTAVLSNVTSASTQTKAGTVVQNFNYQVTASANALAFKKSDLEQFAKNYIISKMPDGKTLLENSFKINYAGNVIDVSGGKATLNLDFSAGTYQNIDKNSLTLSLLGKDNPQIRETINNSLGGEVTNINVKFWPFWVVSAPNNQKVVNIDLKFQ